MCDCPSLRLALGECVAEGSRRGRVSRSRAFPRAAQAEMVSVLEILCLISVLATVRKGVVFLRAAAYSAWQNVC